MGFFSNPPIHFRQPSNSALVVKFKVMIFFQAINFLSMKSQETVTQHSMLLLILYIFNSFLVTIGLNSLVKLWPHRQWSSVLCLSYVTFNIKQCDLNQLRTVLPVYPIAADSQTEADSTAINR